MTRNTAPKEQIHNASLGCSSSSCDNYNYHFFVCFTVSRKALMVEDSVFYTTNTICKKPEYSIVNMDSQTPP